MMMNRISKIKSLQKCIYRAVIVLHTFWFMVGVANANNIQVSSPELNGKNTTSDFIDVQFNISWENSWRTTSAPNNWDAAWIFVKYRVGTGPWLHAFLNNTGHVAGTGTAATIVPGLLNTANAFNATTNPAMGVFVHRSGAGTGSFTQTGIKLRWNYGANGVADNDILSIRVFAIEMVYVPSGSFQVGDGTTTTVQGHFRNGSTNTPLTIGSENALTLGGTANGNLANNNNAGMNTADDFNNTTTRTLPAAFPKGFNAYYCMKYEISQQQWIDFFNLLDNTQKSTRDLTLGPAGIGGKNSDAIVRRNNISYTSGNATLNSGTFGNVACNYLSWSDGAAYADWASLRPMTELEFEKTCRGTLTAVANEYAWGSTSATQVTGFTNSGANNEVASNTGANAVYNSSAGPIRVGSFATASSTRAQAGASYYGIMELSGNVMERIVSVGNATGRNFTAPLHGNGLLTSDGFADISTWPGFVTSKNSDATGSGFRGGNFEYSAVNMRVSDRWLAPNSNNWRNINSGFRAVRSAP